MYIVAAASGGFLVGLFIGAIIKSLGAQSMADEIIKRFESCKSCMDEGGG